jgi:ribosomal-protein-alanine N-acetyltransferase
MAPTLRPATMHDVPRLHALAGYPSVYRFLFDGVAPSEQYIAGRAMEAIANANRAGLGIWVLEGPRAPCAGCVELRPTPEPRLAELTYLLHPDHWGQGLATRMAWTAITLAFASPHIDCVVAGYDLPNTASVAVMRRLGMRFHRAVRYPLGSGAEYILRRDDTGPMPRPEVIPII